MLYIFFDSMPNDAWNSKYFYARELA